MAGSARLSGGQPGNANRTLHGLRASGLPASATYLEGQLRAFRSYVRGELAARGVDAGILHEALLQSAVRHETRALLAAKWLRDQDGELSLDQRLQLLTTISAATDSRDKCLFRLGLDKQDGRTITALYSGVAATACHGDGPGDAGPASESHTGPDAADATPEATDADAGEIPS